MRKNLHFTFSVFFITFWTPVFAQDNSPYSRYGLGDLVPSTNITTRAMGSISSCYNDHLSVNYNNPATYASFVTIREQKSKKLLFGRPILDIGINLENRTLIEPNTTGKFTASNALFSHVQIGIPLRSNWGMSFGLRPLTRISYSMIQGGKVLDALPPHLPTGDSTVTQSEGDGGSYLASAGTGFKIGNFSFGINAGYLFGKTDYSSRKSILNDTVQYTSGNFQTTTTFGNFHVSGGMQYSVKIDSSTYLTLGAYGNLKQKLNATQDLIRESYFFNPNVGNARIDSVYEQSGVKGKIDYPASYTAGFMFQRMPSNQKGGWLIGVDYHQGNWEEYRMYGKQDSLRNKMEIRLGGELRPSLDAARKSYWGNVAYRAGFFVGTDYVQVKQKLPVLGATFGLGLPLRNFNRLNNQVTLINVAFEYIKRGNNENLLKENLFRISIGFSVSDLWFSKRKYE
ncbi:MAG: hypothetical protein ACHQFX_11530 [Chitinophagales bacterium]